MLTQVARLLKLHPNSISLPLHPIVGTGGEPHPFVEVSHWLHLLDDIVNIGYAFDVVGIFNVTAEKQGAYGASHKGYGIQSLQSLQP